MYIFATKSRQSIILDLNLIEVSGKVSGNTERSVNIRYFAQFKLALHLTGGSLLFEKNLYLRKLVKAVTQFSQ